jgi:hypothetical protein
MTGNNVSPVQLVREDGVPFGLSGQVPADMLCQMITAHETTATDA